MSSYIRTVRVPAKTLTAKKAGMVNRAMKDYRRARQLACEYFHEHGTADFTYSDREDLRKDINANDRVTLSARTVYPAITTVEQNYGEYEKDERSSPPQANYADTLALEGQDARIFHTGEGYYLNISTGKGTANLPLWVSDDKYHSDRLPKPDAVPPVGRSRTGVQFADLEPEHLPTDTIGLSTSTLSKVGERQYVANLVFEIEKRVTQDIDEPAYVLGVDRGRNQLAYAALYNCETDTVEDWFNYPGDEFEHTRDRFAERIAEFQRAGAWDDMETARRQRYRYKRQLDYEIANEIVDMARGRFGVVIATEDLQGMSRLGNYTVENRRFADWSYYRQGEYIKQKAEPFDIPVKEVPPRNTSRDCSRCGDSEETERKSVHFRCKACGYEQHADANAAVNIAKRSVIN